MIELKHVSFSYDDKHKILDDISMKLGQDNQSVIGIIGHNGAGKSTLFLNLVGELRPTAGEILVDGKKVDYSKKGLRNLRRKVGIVFQNSDQQIFYSIVKDDVAFALRNLKVSNDEIKQRVERVLRELDISNLKDQPIQYLSGGQKKRVAIAGIMVIGSEWILLDEPTSGLDPDGRLRMKKLIKKLIANGQKIILSSHDMDFMYEMCDYFYLLGNNRILKEGNRENVFNDEQLLRENNLEQPWLVKIHQKLGLPLYTTEQELFAKQGK
ncbi:ATPase component CbiO of energizing module of cobalt ECF transporter [Limosilactobacillus reuteri]|jgi:cobalt/nickel transport system ATP-binding protein|uniref:ABC transporter ATP-binding protein n=1 Tax=Limosilactobacillus reuteri TaxID=1598 RepID=A0A0U5JYG1_LIMRT|nr:ATP-binding cassette domain-containing protein [Limosilactobacillus reuteri]CUR39248.1 ATPase component CbiO of energizing module of cobalt ECF transporter [Limosilactobacillus reuteri subsp. porcinus]CUR41924.1 ATPase component CbiO of energizing module of cobalt ECF transporter [Limosilactobacillus reuteri]